MSKWTSLVVVALVLGACGGSRRTVGTDAGSISVVDSGSSPGVDAARPDSGGSSGDPCASSASEALATLGCNGGYASSATPAANAWLGTCTVAADPETTPQGSCTVPNAVCAAADGATTGVCLVVCPVATTYISSGGCPSGGRCFLLGMAPDQYGLCFRDCDASHTCPSGFTCDAEGSCVGQ